MILAQNDFGTTFFEEENRILQEHFRGRFNIDLLTDHFEAIENFLESNNAKGSIVDIGKVYGSFYKILEYVENSYFPTLEKSGIRYQAYIIADDLMIKNLIGKVEKLSFQFNIEIKIFYDIEIANTWLQEKLQNE